MGVDVAQLKADFEAFRDAVKSRVDDLKAKIETVHGEVAADIQDALDALHNEINAGTLEVQADQAADTEQAATPDPSAPETNPLNQAADPNVAAAIHPAPVVDGGAAPVGTNFAPEAGTDPTQVGAPDGTTPAEGETPAA